jgi:undecaprenyl-diphosphatase
MQLVNMFSILKGLDQQVFGWINGHHTSWGDHIAYWFSHRFFWLPLYIFLIYLLIQVFQKKAWMRLLVVAFLIICCDQLSSTLVKPWVQRLRPCEEPKLKQLVHVVGDYTGIYGFISSHAANSFGLAMLLWLILHKYYRCMYLLFLWAWAISYARIYGGVHYPGDVLVGALAGLLIAWFIYKIYNYWLGTH